MWTKNIISTNTFRHTIFGLKSLPPARSSPTNKYLFWAVLLVRCFITPEIASIKSSRRLQCNILMENHWSRVTYITDMHKNACNTNKCNILYKSYCSTVHFCRITSIYQATNAHIISHKTLLEHFKTLPTCFDLVTSSSGSFVPC